MVYDETKDDTRSGFAVPIFCISTKYGRIHSLRHQNTGMSYFSFLSEAIDNNHSVVLMVAKVTIDTDRWKMGNGNIYSVTPTMITRIRMVKSSRLPRATSYNVLLL